MTDEQTERLIKKLDGIEIFLIFILVFTVAIYIVLLFK